jgi:hypothetical protein
MVKRILFFWILLFFVTSISGQIAGAAKVQPLTESQVASLAVLGKAWGFFKYYHPRVAKGQYNWDSVLIVKVPVFLSLKDQQGLNDCMLHWLNELGQVAPCPTCDNTLSDRISWNFDTTWVANSGFKPDVISELQFILANRSQGENFYVAYGPASKVKVTNEASYNNEAFQYPSPEYRLLTLFRYWNIVNYFSPYKYLTTKKWDQVLSEFISVFYEAKDTMQYDLGFLKLVGALEDGHNGIYWTSRLLKFLGEYKNVPFLCSIVEGKAVVTLITNDSLCNKQGIALNDVIIAIDGETIEERIRKYLPYVYNASNSEYGLQSLCALYLFAGKTGTCEITKLTLKGSAEKHTIKRYNNSLPYNDPPAVTWKRLRDNIGYINMGQLETKDVNAIMDSLWATKGIIFDLRNYPQNTWSAIAARLCSKKFLMGRLSHPDLSYPGLFKYHSDRFDGNENKQPYKGKVILLVNVLSKSHAEFSAMGLQAATKTITIGSTTAGADGDFVEWITLPGGFKTRFSGLGVYYPDGTVAQRKGVKIDIVCKPTIKGLQPGKDELIETAVKVINKN